MSRTAHTEKPHTPSITVTYSKDDRYADSNQRRMWGQTFWEQTNLLLAATEW